jgi:AhpD family alkylhydroperoxidase
MEINEASMRRFNRRTYHNPGEAIRDVWAVMSRRKEIHSLMDGETLDPAFRERLMLAVTAVNNCRYCSYAHTRAALEEGVSQAEIQALAMGAFDGCPPEQVEALCYAQHWAESNGNPDPEARKRVLERYGERKLAAIELALCMIRVGNLSGNTLDWFLYHVSLGRWGTTVNRPSG